MRMLNELIQRAIQDGEATMNVKIFIDNSIADLETLLVEQEITNFEISKNSTHSIVLKINE